MINTTGNSAQPIACRTCGLIQSLTATGYGAVAVCCRCGSPLGVRKADSVKRTLAFALAALICYVPANLYPILHMQWVGVYSESTLWEGSVKLFQDGQWLVACIVFMASIVVPFLKLVGLIYLVVTVRFDNLRLRGPRFRIYRVIEVIGPWAMLDVFLLSVLVALVKLGQVATVLPGPGLLAFTAVVVFSILATASFDPALLWTGMDRRHDRPE